MESSINNPATITKRLWHMVQIVYCMLRKGVSRRKLILDLHLLLKHGKLARKAVANLLTTTFHHHHHHHPHASSKEVEFSCSNTPSHARYFHSMARRKSRRHRREEFDSFDAAEMAMAFRMMNAEESEASPAASSALPTPSPAMVRQLRITDSPFPIDENEVVDVGMIDKKADKFIKRFYEQLMMQQSASEGATPDHGGYRRRPIAGGN